jgi:hypothetical protein
MPGEKRVSFNNKVDIHYFNKEEEPEKINNRQPFIKVSTLIMMSLVIFSLYYFIK